MKEETLLTHRGILITKTNNGYGTSVVSSELPYTSLYLRDDGLLDVAKEEQFIGTLDEVKDLIDNFIDLKFNLIKPVSDGQNKTRRWVYADVEFGIVSLKRDSFAYIPYQSNELIVGNGGLKLMPPKYYLDKDLKLQPSTADARYYELIEVIEVIDKLTEYLSKQ